MKNKVLVAMGIGIFAALTFNATSVTTLAEDGNPQPQEPSEDNELADAAADAADEAEDAFEEAVKTINGEPAEAGDTPEIQEKKKGTEQAEQNLEDAAKLVYGKDINIGKAEDEPTKEEKITQETAPEAKDLKDELYDGDWVGDYKENYKGEIESDKNKFPVGGDPDPKTPLDDINGQGGLLDQMENKDTLAAGKAAEIANKAGEINGKVDAADQLVNEAENLLPDDLVSNGSNFVESASSALANADTPEQADEILESANQVVNGINQQIQNANNRIAQIDSELSTLKSQHQNLVGQYNTKKQELEDFEKQFQDLKEVAMADAEAVEAERARLQGEAQDLLNAAKEAKKNYDESLYAELQKQENILKNGSLVGKSNQEKLDAYRTFVYLVMCNYYVPDVLGGEVLDSLDDFVNKNWNADQGNNFKYKDNDGNIVTSTKGNVLRYGKIKIKDIDDNEQVLYVNYKSANGNDLFSDDVYTQSGYPGIVIFEKVKHNVIGMENISDEDLATLDAGKQIMIDDNTLLVKEGDNNYVYYDLRQIDLNKETLVTEVLNPTYEYKETTNNDQIKEELNDGKGSYKLIDVKNDISYGEKVDIKEDTVTKSISNKDGKYTQEETADVERTTIKQTISTTTTTTFTGSSLSANAAKDAKLADSDAAKAAYILALQGVVNELKDGEVLVIGEGKDAVEFKKGDKVESAVGYQEDKFNTTEPVVTGHKYTVSVNYNSKFTINQHISGTKTHTNGFNDKIDEDEAYEAFLDEVDSIVKKYRYKDGDGLIIKDQLETDLLGSRHSQKDDGTFKSEITNRDSYWFFGDHDTYDRSYEGDLTIDYAKLSYITVDKSWFIFTGGSVDEKTAKKELENRGYKNTKVVALDKWDDEGGWGSYTIYFYFDDQTETVEIEGSSEEAVTNQAVMNALVAKQSNFVNSSNTDKINIASQSITATSDITVNTPVTYYGYKALNFFIKTVSSLTADAVYENEGTPETKKEKIKSSVVEGTSNALEIQYRNDNWYSGNIILAEFDNGLNEEKGTINYLTDGKEGSGTVTISAGQNDDFRNKVDNVGLIPDSYDRLINKAEASWNAFVAAEAKVKTLKDEIAALNSKRNAADYRNLEYDLANARAKLNSLMYQRDLLVNRLNEVTTERDNRVNYLNSLTIPAGEVVAAPLAFVAPAGAAPAAAPAAVFAAAPGGAAPIAAAAPVGAVLGANRAVEGTILGAQVSGSVLGERRGPQGAVLGKRRSPKTADAAMGGMIAGMMLSMMTAFGGAAVLKKKREDEE